MKTIGNTTAVIESGIPGPTLLVLGGIHGDEQCGIDVVRSIIDGSYVPELRCGTLVVSLGNVAAIESQTRCINCNLNRGFLPDKTACDCDECARIPALKKLMNEADVLIDIHASFTPESEPFLICERNAKLYIQGISVEKVCFGFDSVQPGGTDYYMNSIGKVGICIECGYLGDPASTQCGFDALLVVLRSLRMIEGEPALVPKKYLQAEYQYYTRRSFTLCQSFADFEEVAEGQLIGIDGDVEVRAPTNGRLLFAGNAAQKGDEAFVFLTSYYE